MIAGRVCTQISREKPCVCGLGPMGCFVCLATLPIGVYHPIAGFGVFCLISNYFRSETLKRYNIEEEKTFCCGEQCNACLDYFHFGCNYPCSLFQVRDPIVVSLHHTPRLTVTDLSQPLGPHDD